MKHKFLKLLGLSIISISLSSCVTNSEADDSNKNFTIDITELFPQEISYEYVEKTNSYKLVKNISKTKHFSVANSYKEAAVTLVDTKACYNNTYMTTLNLSSKLKRINSSAFEGCTKLENVYIYDNVLFGEDVFKNCDKLNTLDEANLSYLEAYSEKEEDNDYYYLIKTLTDTNMYLTNVKCVSILDAFKNNTKVEDVVLNEGLKYINSAAFKNSTVLRVNIPTTIEYIGSNAFYGCENLTFTMTNTIKGYFINSLDEKVEVTLTNDNIKDYLVNTYVNYEFYKD